MTFKIHHTSFRVTFNSVNKLACSIYNIKLHHPFAAIQSNLIHQSFSSIRPNPIQPNPIHGCIQPMSNSGARPMSIVATVAHLSYRRALILTHNRPDSFASRMLGLVRWFDVYLFFVGFFRSLVTD